MRSKTNAFIAALTPALALGGSVIPPPIYYDLEGSAGSALAVTYARPTGRQTVWPAEGEPIVYEGLIGPHSSPLPGGTLYVWLTESEVGGTYAGWAAADQIYANGSTPGIHRPIQGSSISFGLLQNDSPQAEGRAYCVVYPKIVDDFESPSLWADWPHVAANGDRTITVSVEYLEGNTLFNRGTDFCQIQGTGGYDLFQLSWGDSSPSEFPHHDFGAPAPEGPALLSISIDGYTTDTVTLQMKPTRVHQWGAALEPLSKESASASSVAIVPLPPSPPVEFVTRALTWRLSGHCLDFTNLEQHMNLNSDGAVDVGDLVHGQVAP